MKNLDSHLRRKRRIRKKISGSTERPRLSVYRSARHIYAQVIDDIQGTTLAAVSTLSKELRDSVNDKNKSEAAKMVGQAIAKLCAEKEITKVVFDRNGHIYHGRIRALAEGAREGGLDF